MRWHIVLHLDFRTSLEILEFGVGIGNFLHVLCSNFGLLIIRHMDSTARRVDRLMETHDNGRRKLTLPQSRNEVLFGKLL